MQLQYAHQELIVFLQGKTFYEIFEIVNVQISFFCRKVIRFQPASSHWSFSIHHENIRKPRIFLGDTEND